MVERTLAWLSRNRRLAKDFEAIFASAQAWLSRQRATPRQEAGKTMSNNALFRDGL